MTEAPGTVPSEQSPTVLGDLGEAGILAVIRPILEPAPAEAPNGTSKARLTVVANGDDAAVLSAPDGRYVVSTDILVEGEDFLRTTSSASDVGAKAAAQNLADIAAMGARPTALVLGLVAPISTPIDWVCQFASGLAERCTAAGAQVVGGDLSAGPVIMVSVTVFGDLDGREPLTRKGARPGDLLALCGTVGFAAAGLDVLRKGSALWTNPVAAEAVSIQRAARPVLAAGPAAADAGATALIDVSDGLLRDSGRVAAASGVHLTIDCAAPALLEVQQRLRPVADLLAVDDPSEQVWRWLLTGGEDHALLATLPADGVLPEGFSVIGRVSASTVGQAPAVHLSNASQWQQQLIEVASAHFDHF